MDYFLINTCPLNDPELVCFASAPSGMQAHDYKYNQGIVMAGIHPPDAKMVMTERYSGMVLSGLLCNIDRLLILHRMIVELMVGHDSAGELMELLPVQIINHKGRVASCDYVIVNPLQPESCLDLEKSDVKRTDSGTVRRVETFVLKRPLIDARRAIFRPAEQPDQFLARIDWLKKVKALPLNMPPNIFGKKIEVSE